MWAVPDYVPTVVEPIADISTYQALTSMQTITLITRLSITLGLSIFSLLGISVLRSSRITFVLVPLLELGPIPNSKKNIAIAHLA